MSESISEVAQLRQQIEAEFAAALSGLHGYACTARHDFIEARMDCIGTCHERLIDLVGEREASRMIVEVLAQKR